MVPEPAEEAGDGPPEYQIDFWNRVSPERPSVQLSCFMPNGIFILLNTNYTTTLAEIKEDLWEEASKLPLYGKLHDISVYIFKFINSMAEHEEVLDESRRLCDIKPTGAMFIISEVRDTSIDHAVNVSIGHLIGKGLQEFDALNSSEVNSFRFKMRKMGEEIAKQRGDSWREKLICQYPLRVTPTPLIDDSEKVHHGLDQIIQVQTICEPELNESATEQDTEILERSFKFNVPADTLPDVLIAMNLSKSSNALIMKNDKVTDYVLKACGREEYIIGDYKLIDFHYIQECLLKDIVPSLLMVHINRLPVVNRDYDYLASFDMNKTRSTSYNSNTLRKKKNTKSSWSITDNYAITLCTASRLNYDIVKPTELGIQAGLFHGGRPLCQPLKTDEQLVCQRDEVDFDVSLEFDIQICNIPRNTKLCIVIYEVNKGNDKGAKPKKPKDPKESQIIAIAWGNTSVYDFKGQLKSGATTLYLWTYAEDIMPDDLLNPLGTVVNNPNTEYSTALTLVFKNYEEDINFMYPCMEAIMDYARNIDESTGLIQTDDIGNCKRLFDVENVYDLHDQERKKIWSLRKYWMQDSPEFFPKLLCCIDWDKRDEISQVMVLLREWPKLPIEKSLELLDYAYADQEVRSFAVQCLKDISDEDLLLYLLQLVQAIKHELYLECDLVTFLLRRALHNRNIGHYLFWHLRSEMQVASVSVRFGLILEAYCRGNQDHIPILQKQLNLVDKLKQCSELVRDRKEKEKTKIILRQFLSNGEVGVRNPLDPCLSCKIIKVDKCRVMDSKMKPLWVVFENSDKFGEDIYLIFKNGDDLRQDMLTLQMLRIMDRLWKNKGLDLRLNPYNCISLENRVGMIEVVLHAETIANIQKEKGIFTATAAFRRGPILAWLKDYNTTEASLNKAIEEFTYSCAGYCVATYVLGIADRHSDNIMLKRNGQMFHIDFGHILGHFKEKFGIKRERVPFVLTHDFVHVINKGQKPQPSALEFRMFQSYCEKAFRILRENANLIISLFAMMISTGLPELSSEKDLQYLRESLALSKSDEEAAAHFKSKFDEALSNSWKTSLNWASHNISKNNKA